ncbi:uncharacterized protein LOC118767837 isoform X1 [Octopus sinensis]|uniref:Uncharacterized protein LOC118767837 isoform X1 n=1 Tax=Octopus sinensis TaxID=2607531 RepID=A0A7E6FMV9_9MOLL|nr:uncharacterized protein LOC118767837 isoform X1 [Octopus sinensis]
MCTELSPDEIRYSQDSISNTFHNGETLEKVISTIIGGETMPDNMTKTAVFKEYGKYYACDNRKLYVLKEVQRRSKPNFKIEAKVVRPRDKSKFTTKNDGASIRIRCPSSRGGTVRSPNGAKRYSSHNDPVMDDLDRLFGADVLLAEEIECEQEYDRLFGADVLLAEEIECEQEYDRLFGADVLLAEEIECENDHITGLEFDLAEEIECALYLDRVSNAFFDMDELFD